MNPSPIIDRLSAIRRVARRRLLLFGVFAVLAGGITAFFTIVLVDWLVWLPPVLRLVAASLFIAGFVAASLHWIITPLRAPFTIQELAGKIERSFPPLQDRLASSVNFLERGETGSSRMAQHVVDATQKAIEEIPLERALVGGPVTRRAFAFAGALAMLVITMWWSPQWVQVGAKRYIHPWSGTEWPRTVAIVPTTFDQVAAMGDTVVVSMRIERGWNPDLRAVVHFREPDGNISTRTLNHDGDGAYSTSIDAVTSDLSYWFEAGDATTEDHSSTVNMVRRPEVMEATALVEPPPYAATAPARLMDLRDGPIQAFVGGFVTFQFRASKRVANNEDKTALGLRCDDGTWIALHVDPDDPSKLSARWTVTRDLEIRPELHDEYGFENRGTATYTLRALPDAPPTLVVLEPPSVSEATTSGFVRMVIRAEDDFGIEELRLAVARPDDQTLNIPIEISQRSMTSDSGVQVIETKIWEMAPLSAAPGDVISYRAIARDNYQKADLEGQETASPEMRIKILSDSEFELRIREDLAALEERVRRTAFDQAALHDEALALHTSGESVDELKDSAEARRGAAGAMSLAQMRIARQVRDTAVRFDEIVRRMERNAPGDNKRDRVAQLGETLRSVAAGPMAGASALLGKAREPADRKKSQEVLSEATQAQQAALNGLRDVLRSMGQWGAFQGVVSRTQDLLDRQSQIRLQTTELGKSTLGKSLDTLEPDELAALRENQHKQEQLLDDVTEHLARLEQMRQSVAEKDPGAADSLDAAMRAARGEDLIRHVREAATSIAANRTGAAESQQRAASQALQKMLAQLRQREDRELAQLRKKLDDAATQVDQLIEEQKGLLAQVQGSTSPAESELEAMSEAQRTLSRNAKYLGEELVEDDSTADAGRIVRQSAMVMTKAEDELLASDTDSAVLSQQDALRMLNDARETLLAAEQKAAEEMLRRTLADIQQELQGILAAQQAINAAMAQLRDALKTEGTLNRSQNREAARLSKEQLDARGMVTGLLPDMEQTAVYRWALERVSKWMGANQESIEAREFSDDSVVAAGRIAHELENLIAALVQTQTMPLDTEFAESGQSGGGSSDAASAPTLPSLTELLVLKTMQDDINARTASMYTRFDAQNPTEHSLRELTMLGEDQNQVQKLAQMVTDRARRK